MCGKCGIIFMGNPPFTRQPKNSKSAEKEKTMKKANRTNRAKRVFTPRERLTRWDAVQKYRFTEKPMQYPKIQKDNRGKPIDESTLYDFAISIAVKAATVNYSASGDGKMLDMVRSCIRYADGFKNDERGGADLIQEVALFLWGYNGHTLEEFTTDGQKDKNGNPITVLRGALRHVQRYINGHRHMEYRRVYITDYEENHGEIAVPPELHIDDFVTFTDVNKIIQEMGLTEVEKSVLMLRLRGFSNHAIAEKRGVSRQAIIKAQKRIQAKYIAVRGVPVSVTQ